MAEKTPIQGLSTDFICAECQRAALDHIAKHPTGVGAVFAWCSTTRRGLFLRSWDGEIEIRDVSKPGNREYLERLCLDNWERWLAVAEQKQAEIEFAHHVGPVH
ncbi:hypothetical protein [Salinisphaera sp. Q1T1-3]|uniref:hypothetical protein n=1 Tax=Salinisphaera sp. Q1T1-3 TaxID=2321229 RepID=UPI000E712A38|nr:hypothetical protein [Salinisphaera sp. Q1T1-3]RJS95280.1 hypothetical protein D3260_01640 [Salinisphaera sp. Q1T1-3]